MKYFFSIIFSVILSLQSNYTFANEKIPDELYIKQHWISYTTSYDIETRTRKIGSLYRKLFSFLLTYEFFDSLDNKLAIAKSKFFSYTAYFDIYDVDDNKLGAAREKFWSFYPTFDIYAADSLTKLATAKMNFWGTTFNIYDPLTRKKMAEMRRPFFRMKNDWNFRITNEELFNKKDIDSRVLLTVIAFQGDSEYWKSIENKHSVTSIAPLGSETQNTIDKLLQKINSFHQTDELRGLKEPELSTLNSVANEIDEQYQKLNIDESFVTNSNEEMTFFVSFCLKLLESDQLNPMKKKAILILLKNRLHTN